MKTHSDQLLAGQADLDHIGRCRYAEQGFSGSIGLHPAEAMTSCGMYQRHRAVVLIALTVGLLLGGAAIVAQAPVLDVPPAAEASPTFDAGRATEAYIALVPPEQRARSDAYFEGGNWLQLWDSLYSIFTLGLLLALGWSARMRDLARRITTRRPLQTMIYWVQFVLYVSVVSFPLTVYSGFYREHRTGWRRKPSGPGWASN